MEAIFARSTADHHQSISPYKQMKNTNPTKKTNHTSRSFISRSTENLPPVNYNSNSIHGGLFFAPPRPDPKDLPRDVSKVLSSSVTVSGNDVITNPVFTKDCDPKFPGSVFTLSPHPSSLPLPKFSMKPKRSCTAEASGVDAGATDNLRRLLRIR
ncbi:hypothetical protein NC651_004918 [Populus alba x Populus x berolinensis]|nr:hypothetical protein NC651_004918 [Populus alba x Populus x berolinensis]